jgi:hypothetical protein
MAAVGVAAGVGPGSFAGGSRVGPDQPSRRPIPVCSLSPLNCSAELEAAGDWTVGTSRCLGC